MLVSPLLNVLGWLIPVYPYIVNYFKLFESRGYIHKDARKGKFDSKGDEGIFHSTRSKTYKHLNKVTNTMIESVNVRIDEFTDKNDEETKREPKDYNLFVYV